MAKLARVVRDFDIHKLPEKSDYSFEQDADGNLWFARSIRAKREDDPPVGAELYKFDGDRATQFVIEGEVPEINFMFRIATDSDGTRYLFRQFETGDSDEKSVFAIDRDDNWVTKQTRQWKDYVAIGGERCYVRNEDGTKLAVVAQATKKKVSSFKAARHCRVISTRDHVFTYNSYFIDVRDAKGKLLRTFDWDAAAKQDAKRFEGEANNFLMPTPIDADTLFVPFGSRHSETDVTLYTLRLADLAFQPSPFEGRLKRRPYKCLFDRRGRLWASHLHNPARGYPSTTFSTVEP